MPFSPCENDLKLSDSTRNIDLIMVVTSTYLKEPVERFDLDNKPVTIYQTNGQELCGKLDITLER